MAALTASAPQDLNLPKDALDIGPIKAALEAATTTALNDKMKAVEMSLRPCLCLMLRDWRMSRRA